MFEETKPPVDIFADVDKGSPTAQPSEVVTPPAGARIAHGPSKLLLGLIVVVVLSLGLGVYRFFFAGKVKKSVVASTNAAVVNTNPEPVAPVVVPPAPEPSTPEQTPTNTNTTLDTTASATAPVQPPEAVQKPVDSDGDGLTDAEEAQLGTNPQSADTDQDGLSDDEEVKVWHTDPKNPDTDGDGYLDGQEVRGGFNPNGQGKLFAVPKK